MPLGGRSSVGVDSMMASKIYRVGVVGAGGIAAGHIDEPPAPFKNPVGRTPWATGSFNNSHVACLALMPRVEIVGMCDLAPELLEQFNHNWGERWPKANVYTDHREMLAKEELDILHVVTSEHRHADITVDGARAGVKGIFCEKPLATSMEDATRMIEACEENGVVLIAGYTRRWQRLYHTVGEAIRSGAIGPLGSMAATMGGMSGMLFRNATHAIDALCFFAESDPVKVFAKVEEGFEHWDRFMGVGGVQSQKTLDDPGVSGFILFRNGVRALLCGTKNTFTTNTIQLSGSLGQIYFGMNDHTAKLSTRDPATGELISRTLIPRDYQVYALIAAFEELIGIVENGGTSVSPAREGRKTVQIMEGFLNSQQAGCRLIDVPA